MRESPTTKDFTPHVRRLISRRLSVSALKSVFRVSDALRQNLLIQLHLELLHQPRLHIVKKMRDVGHRAVFVEGLLVFELLLVGDPAWIVYALVQLVAHAASLLVGWIHQR